MPLPFTSLISTEQLTRTTVKSILEASVSMEDILRSGGSELLRGKILASLFYEPSTRTRLSFETAMQRLGGMIITADSVQFSSLYKGESIEDTMVMVSQYADIVTMRHPELGSAARAASSCTIPFINAGDGPGQHPTQALLDLYTIQKELRTIDNIHIAMVGDLKFGRTVHSLTQLLTLFNNIRITYVSPKELRIPEKLQSLLTKHNITFVESEDMADALKADIVYMTRVQGERFTDPKEYERLKLRYILSAAMLQGKKAIIMHPLPRVGEIALDVDTLPNAAYFRQAGNGVAVRMALLALLLRKL